LAFALLALPAALSATLCQDCDACPMEARPVDADCHGSDTLRLVADCCANLVAPAAQVSDRALTAGQGNGTPQVRLPAVPVQNPRHETAAYEPAATPPVAGVRLHILLSIYLI
jgi:hypothetical protein